MKKILTAEDDKEFYRMDAHTSGGSGPGLYVVKLMCGKPGWKADADITDDIFSVIITMN